MKWDIKTGSLLDEPAEVLVCSANPHLTLSGGVGADLLARYGAALQEPLAAAVRARTPHFLNQGEIFVQRAAQTPYLAILHAVAIDGWYESSPTVIQTIVTEALTNAAKLGARRVALAALATGFGHLSLDQFAEGVRPLLQKEFPPIESVCICLLEEWRAQELAGHLPEASFQNA